MKIYFAGIMGVGIGPLAVLAGKVGHQIFGSDQKSSLMEPALAELGATIEIGAQDGNFLAQINQEYGLDWFIYTSALKDNHPELVKARELGLRVSKRDALLNEIIAEKHLKLVAVAGTHGKTTTTSMLIWCCQQLGRPIAFATGTTLAFAPPADYQPGCQYLVYEADEYDRNFLAFHPHLAIIPAISYDHPDTYPTAEDYERAFDQFKVQSESVIQEVVTNPSITLLGEHNRHNASLVLVAMRQLFPELELAQIVAALNTFPGAGRRFEQLAPHIFSDYAVHPHEIRATLQLAREYADRHQLKQVIAIYQPHQNLRQQLVAADYPTAFRGADRVIWLPTYLSRESDQDITPAAAFVQALTAQGITATTGQIDDSLIDEIRQLATENLVLMMTAGDLDGFVRTHLLQN